VTFASTARRVAALVAAACVTAFILTPAAPVQAADNGAWAVTPTQKGDFTPRQYFFVEASGGQSIRDSITIKNVSDQPLVLDVYPADAFNVPVGGGFALKDQDVANSDVGTWIKLSRSKVEVPAATIDGKTGNIVPGESRVPFVMTVPRGVSPGDHAGGIATLEPAPKASPGGGSQLLLRRNLGVRMYVRISGPLTPSMSVQKVELDGIAARLPYIGRQGGATVTYTIKNTGNVRITPGRLLTLKGVFGRTLHSSGAGQTPEILPGSTVILSETFVGMPVLDRVTARVVLDAKELPTKPAGDTTKWVVSWIFLGLVLALLVAVLTAVWWARRHDGAVGGAEEASDAQVLVDSQPELESAPE